MKKLLVLVSSSGLSNLCFRKDHYKLLDAMSGSRLGAVDAIIEGFIWRILTSK
jgi:hypothetical protein